MITLRAGPLEADVVPEAGMLVASLRHSGDELLGQRSGLEDWIAKGSTMGVPLLYPWVNRVANDRFGVGKRDPNGLPMHGLPAARGAWTVEDESRERVRAHLDWPGSPGIEPHRVSVTHELSSSGLRTTTEIAGEGVPVAFGWHPYLVATAETEVVIPVARRLVLDERGLPTGERTDAEPYTGPLGDRTYDDLFEAPAEPFRAGRVTVRFEAGAPYAQVYAPPDDDVICFEPMAAPTNALVSGDDLPRSPWRMVFALEA